MVGIHVNLLRRRPRLRRAAPGRGRPNGTPSSGFTLIEMLVTMAVTLILITALSQTFAVVGEAVAKGRAAIEMASNLRSVGNRLQGDLDRLTCFPVVPPTDDTAGIGYFEYVEGVGTDYIPVPSGADNNIYGDLDDALMFTASSDELPFRGDHYGSLITSPIAEIAWFTRFDDRDGDGVPGRGEVTLYRRTLIVSPNYPLAQTTFNSYVAGVLGLLSHYKDSDLSVRLEYDANTGLYTLKPNSLSHLTRRENRFAHRPLERVVGSPASSPAFPHLLERRLLVPRATTLLLGNDGGYGKAGADDNGDGTMDDVWETGWFGSDDVSDRDAVNVSAYGYGTDVVLSDVLAFDVRAYDPDAEVRTVNGVPVVPGDPGWPSGTPLNLQAPALGAFVDLNYLGEKYAFSSTFSNTLRTSWFSGYPAFRDLNGDGQWNVGEPFLGVPCITPNQTLIGTSYCSWSMHYERDGFDQDGLYGADQGTDGLDNDNQNGPDDTAENETSSPYPVPLRGVQIKIRLYEPDTRQVRQVTVVGKLTDQ